ncbi:MAG TPA: ABC transporter substrate-binding protein [Acetobacteraceae bacterium]|nr:ABC transporter substrate-binding protein [Acetobacteraceae bacterium]
MPMLQLARRTVLQGTGVGLALPAIRSARAGTPPNVVVMAKTIKDIVNGFDPVESYEASNNEVCGNCYRKLVAADPDEPGRIVGDVAERWDVSADGRTLTFHIRAGVLFDSGNRLTADDVVFSLRRIVQLRKFSAFLLTQFGFTRDNMEECIRADGDDTVVLSLPELWSTDLVLRCLAHTVGCIVDKRAALANQAGDDLGNGWLRTHTAGAGRYRLVSWRASDHIVLEANAYAMRPPALPRVVIRHMDEPSARLLSLMAGDVDVARVLGADELRLIGDNPAYGIASAKQILSMYLGMNEALPPFTHQEVRQAVKLAIDYDAIERNLTPGLWSVCQSFLPPGIPGAIAENPFRQDVARAKRLMVQAGFGEGFSVTLDHVAAEPFRSIAQAIQANLAAIGIKAQPLGAAVQQLTTKTRTRHHEMALVTRVPDYVDPHTNAQAFCFNADDSDNSSVRMHAWRNHFVDPELTGAVTAAAKELDHTTRMGLYETMQRQFMERSPCVMLLQQTEVGLRKGVSGLRIGVIPDYTTYGDITKH